MRKFSITLLYVVFFWIVIPVVLFRSSRSLDIALMPLRTTRLMRTIGFLVSLGSAVLLVVSVFHFTRGAKKLPISALPPYNKVVTTGVYSLWRHPIYLFYTLVFVGLGIFLGSAGMLFVVLPIFITLETIHAWIEEVYLIKKHGKAYRQYQKATALIIPKPLVRLISTRFPAPGHPEH